MKDTVVDVRVIFLLLGLFTTVNALSQDSSYYFENYTDHEYMFLSSVKSITQDSLGFMWFGTNEGLIRFDGLRFDLYQNDRRNPKTIASNLIMMVDYDHYSDQIVIGGGYMDFSFFDPNTLECENFNVDQTITSKFRGYSHIRQMLRVDSSNFILASNQMGLIKYHEPTQHWTVLVTQKSKKPWGNRGYCLHRDSNFIWAGTNKGIAKLNSDLQIIEWFNLPDSIQSKAVLSISTFDVEQLLISSRKRLYLFNRLTGTWKLANITHPLMKGIVRHVVDNQGNIWVATLEEGLFFINNSDKKITNYRANPGNEQSILHNVINDIYFSKMQNILWVGTHKGITKIDYNRKKFKVFDVTQLSETSVENLFFLYKDTEQGYWFWDSSGLYHMHKGQKLFRKAYVSGMNKIPPITGAASLGNGQHLFVSVGGVFLYDPRKKYLTNVGMDFLNGIGTTWFGFYGLAVDENKKIWLSHRQGIVSYDPLSGGSHFYRFPSKYGQGAGIIVSDIVVSNNRNEVWVGTKSGYLIRFDVPTGEFTFFDSSLPVTPEFSTTVSILQLNFDSRNRLWVASLGAGLLLFDDDKQRYNNTFSSGPLKSTVYSLEKDKDGLFWITTNYGIVCFDPEDGNYRFYDMTEGVFCDEFNERAHHYGSDGEMVMGGVGGFVSFYPDQIKNDPFVPKVVIKSMMLQRGENQQQTYLAKPIDGQKQISLKASRYPMHFSTAVLNHSIPEKNAIMWKLEGYNNQWLESAANEPIVFTNLKAGSYVLHVKEKTTLSHRTIHTDSVRLVIVAPFYQRWWFYITIVAIVIGLIFLGYWYRIQVHKRRNMMLKQKVLEKTMELQVTNEELQESQEEVITQNEELELHRNYLEQLVEKRTHDMEKAVHDAEEANRLKTAFLANLSHEVRTPMNAIIGFSSILIEDDFDFETRRDLIKRILDNGEGLLSLIDDMVDISTIESGQMRVEVEEVNISVFMQSFFKNLFLKDKIKDVELLLEIDSDLEQCTFETDFRRLRQIFNNLINNALKFTDKGFVKLMVSGTSKDDLPERIRSECNDLNSSILLFRVQDTGIGIKDENLEYIFKPFWKVSDLSNEVYRGMGLGLYITQQLINLLNGEIWVDSYEGEGTVFSFFIPCHRISKEGPGN